MLKLIYALLLHIDGVIYNLIRWVYEIFLALAKINIFDADDYNSIIGRIYLVLGVIMLFVLAYSLLKAVVNPDDSKKDEKTAPNIIKNVVISLVIIAVLPTVFSVAFNLQNAILNSNIIPKIILNRTGVTDIENIEKNGGNTMAFYTFQSFFLPNLESDTCIQANQDLATCSADILIDAGSSSRASNLAEAYQAVYNGESFSLFSNFSEAVDDDEINYMLIVSTVAGVVLLFVIIGYTMDLAVRVVKLVFYQIIAPVAVICRIIPGDKKKAFDIWVKQVIGNFLDVFVRIAAMYLGIYLITLVVSKFGNIFDVTGGLSNLTSTQRSITLVLLIIGIILFVRQVPKLLKDLFGIELSTEGGVLRTALGVGAIGAGAIGAGITSGVQNATATYRATHGQNAGGRIWNILRSTAAGVGAGTVRGAWQNRNVKNVREFQNATRTAIQHTTQARANRANYVASHRRDDIPIIGGFVGSVQGHAQDAVTRLGNWAGLNRTYEQYKDEQEFYKTIIQIDDSSDKTAKELIEKSSIKDNERIMRQATGNQNAESLSTMENLVNMYKGMSFQQARAAGPLHDFAGHQVQINNEADFARYLAHIESQKQDAERRLKRYIKQQGYNGREGVQNIQSFGINLGTGDLQRMSKLNSDRENIQNLVRENQPRINSLNASLNTQEHIDERGRINTTNVVNNYDDMGTLVDSVNQRNIDINAEIERLSRQQANQNRNNNNNGGGH